MQLHLTGRQNDKDGNLIQWWTNSSLDAYYNKSDCIRKQYFEYCANDTAKKLNLTENICVCLKLENIYS